jgi:hypothetical protein
MYFTGLLIAVTSQRCSSRLRGLLPAAGVAEEQGVVRGPGGEGAYHVAVATQKAEAGPGGNKSYSGDPGGTYLFFSLEAVFRFIDGRLSEEEIKRAREAEARRRRWAN